MADKYIFLNFGVPTEREGTTVSTGVGQAGDIVALDAAGKIDKSMMPSGIAADVAVMPASENLLAGDFVNIWNDGGVGRVRKADASTAGKEAHGFVIEGFASGVNATVYFEGTNDQVNGQTPGRIYLSETAGLSTSTAPVNPGNVVQALGVATSATSINAEIGQIYVLA